MGRRGWAALAAKLLGASMIAQVAVLGATALALPFLSPVDFALYGFVMGASAMTVTLSTWAVETRIAVTDEAAAQALRRTGTAVVLGVGLAWALVGVGLLPFTGHWAAASFLAAGGGASLGLHAISAALMLRMQDQAGLANARVVQGLTNAGLILLLLVTPLPSLLVLPIAWVLSTCAALVVMSRALGAQWWMPSLPRRGDWAVLRRETGKQPLSNVLAGAVEPLPLVVLPAITTPQVAGAWALLQRFLQPLMMTAYSVLQPLYYGRAAEIGRDRDWPRFDRWHLSWMRLLLLAFLPAWGAFYLIAWMLPTLLGPEWSSAAWLAWVASGYAASLLVALPLSHTLLLLGRLDVQFRWAVVRFALSVAPFLLLVLGAWGPGATIVAWAVAAAGMFFVQLVLHRRAVATLRAKAV